MPACPPQRFDDVSPQGWERLKESAAAAGISLGSDAGTVSKSGFTVEWSYDSADRSLTITCTKAPFFLKCETVNAKIRDLIEKQLAD